GWGVADAEVFDALAEQRLAEPPTGERACAVDVLNFAAPRYGPLRQIACLNEQVAPFRPDAVVVFGHSNDGQWVVEDLATVNERRLQVPWEFCRKAIEDSGITPGMTRARAGGRLSPLRDRLL